MQGDCFMGDQRYQADFIRLMADVVKAAVCSAKKKTRRAIQ